MGGGDQTTGQAGKVVSPVDLPVCPDADITAEHTHLRAPTAGRLYFDIRVDANCENIDRCVTEKDLFLLRFANFFPSE